jgi:hypothetical protein
VLIPFASQRRRTAGRSKVVSYRHKLVNGTVPETGVRLLFGPFVTRGQRTRRATVARILILLARIGEQAEVISRSGKNPTLTTVGMVSAVWTPYAEHRPLTLPAVERVSPIFEGPCATHPGDDSGGPALGSPSSPTCP